MIKIEVDQTKAVLENGQYRVITAVTYSAGIYSSIFVFNSETQLFSHVAYPYDLINYPEGYDLGVSEGASYYRLNSVTADFEEVSTANSFSNYTLTRIQWLVNQYNNNVTDFTGTNEYTIVGE